MPSNNSGAIIHYWAGAHPGKIGWLVGPSAIRKTKLRPWIPFALDNDAFSAWVHNTTWNEDAWLSMLKTVRQSGFKPLWALVPDVVANAQATIDLWHKHSPVAASFGWPLAFAVQDGMTPADIPNEADVVFIGGSTEWKWKTLPMWATCRRRIHVGRVNEVERLWICERYGVESVDGTGWMQGTERGRQAVELGQYLSGALKPHPVLL